MSTTSSYLCIVRQVYVAIKRASGQISGIFLYYSYIGRPAVLLSGSFAAQTSYATKYNVGRARTTEMPFLCFAGISPGSDGFVPDELDSVIVAPSN